jgi:hypothetical protein
MASLLMANSTNLLSASNATTAVVQQPYSPQIVMTVEKPSYWVQTEISIVVSVVTTLITYWLRDKNRKKEALVKEFTQAVSELCVASEEIEHLVISHLIADPFAAAVQKKSHREILFKVKSFGNRMSRATRLMLRSDAVLFENGYHQWKSALQETPFPVEKKERACKPHEEPVLRVQAAQKDWHQKLTDYSRDCLNGTIRLPLKPDC